MPLVSVLVPMRNAERYITETLQSILQERSTSLEVLVVDDGSTDGSLAQVKCIRDDRIRLVAGSRQGIAAALNCALEQAIGSIILRCDADDLYPAGRIAQQATWLLHHPEAIAVCGNYLTLDPKGHLITEFNCGAIEESITQELRAGTTRTHFCTYAIQADAIRQIGGFRPYFKTAEDIDLQLRLAEVGEVWYQPGITYHYRLHCASITHQQARVEREFYEATARQFAKQRRQRGWDDLHRGCPPIPPQGVANPVEATGKHIQGLLMGSAWQYHQAGNKLDALKVGMRSVLAYPSDISAWQSLVALALKPPMRP